MVAISIIGPVKQIPFTGPIILFIGIFIYPMKRVVDMEKVVRNVFLLDFYGSLLTEHQRNVLDMHYNNDFSLAEISELMNISRQGVHDTIKRSNKILNKYEQKLGLVNRYMRLKKDNDRMLKIVKKLQLYFKEKDNMEDVQEELKQLYQYIASVLEFDNGECS